MPRPVKELLRLVHVEQLDLSQVKRIDFEIISYLKESHPDLYRTLRRAVKSRHRHGADSGVNLAPDGDTAGCLRFGRHLDPPARRALPTLATSVERRGRPPQGGRFHSRRRFLAAPHDPLAARAKIDGFSALRYCGAPKRRQPHDHRTPGRTLRPTADDRRRGGRRQERLARRNDQPARSRRDPRPRGIRDDGRRLPRLPRAQPAHAQDRGPAGGPRRGRRPCACGRGTRDPVVDRGGAACSLRSSPRFEGPTRPSRRARPARRLPCARPPRPRTCPMRRSPVSRKRFLISVV